MRGETPKQPSMLMVVSPSKWVPENHPLRSIKVLADAALAALSRDFDSMYSSVGRPSIPPEVLLKAHLLITLFTVRSERQFCEQLQYNMLFRWFLDMEMSDEPFDATTFTRNRDRLINHAIGKKLLSEVYEQAKAMGLVTEEHFTVDGTLVDAWASMKSFRPKDEKDDSDPGAGSQGGDGNRWVDFKNEKRSNETHESKTDPEAKLAKKSAGDVAKLRFAAHALMENRNGLLVDIKVTQAVGTTETDAALEQLQDLRRRRLRKRRITVGADKNYDNKQFVSGCRALNITPHVAKWKETKKRKSNLDDRTTKHWGYAVSQRKRKLVEEIFGWGKTIGRLRRTPVKGVLKTQFFAHIVGVAYNLTRIARLLPV